MPSGSAVELEVAIRDDDCFFVDVSARETCRVDLEHLIRRSDDLLLAFFSMGGASADRGLDLARASSRRFVRATATRRSSHSATGLATGPDDPLFADREAEPLADGPEVVERVRRDARLGTTNIEGQATICAGLHEARDGVRVDDSL